MNLQTSTTLGDRRLDLVNKDPHEDMPHHWLSTHAKGYKFEQYFLITSDHHWDHTHCNRDLLKFHFDQALTRNAIIFIFGDLFCAMQGKTDKRSSKSELRPEFKSDYYLDEIVEKATDWYKPYAANLALVTKGNHETGLPNKGIETDLTKRFVENMHREAGFTQGGSYRGWLNYRLQRNTLRTSTVINYTHGHGGGGYATKGVPDFNKQSAYCPGADIYVQGHVHQLTHVVNEVEEYQSGVGPVRRRAHFLRSSTYKDEFKGNTWSVRSGQGPRPLGGWWVRLFTEDSSSKINMEIFQTSA
jgi:hypothetical protein